MTDETKAVKTISEAIAKSINSSTSPMKSDINMLKKQVSGLAASVGSGVNLSNYYTKNETNNSFVSNSTFASAINNISDSIDNIGDSISEIKDETIPSATESILAAIDIVQSSIINLGCAGGSGSGITVGSISRGHFSEISPIEVSVGELGCAKAYSTAKFTTTGTKLVDYKIFGAGSTSGAGDYNSVTGKYDIKISVRDSSQIPYHENVIVIPLDQPLYDGQSVSLADTGIDIPTFVGYNELINITNNMYDVACIQIVYAK